MPFAKRNNSSTTKVYFGSLALWMQNSYPTQNCHLQPNTAFACWTLTLSEYNFLKAAFTRYYEQTNISFKQEECGVLA